MYPMDEETIAFVDECLAKVDPGIERRRIERETDPEARKNDQIEAGRMEVRLSLRSSAALEHLNRGVVLHRAG